MGADKPTDRGRAAAAALAALAEHVAAGERVDVLLDRTADLLVNVLSATAAGIALLSDDLKPVVVGTSGEAFRTAGFRQFEIGEGPWVDAVQSGQAVTVLDIEGDGARWPTWANGGVEPKSGALLAAPIAIAGRVAGVLGLGWPDVGAPDDDEVELAYQVAVVVVAHALVLGNADAANLLAGQLEHALQSRVVIEQAKGMLAERLGVGLSEAYRLLRFNARSRRTRVHLVAEQVVAGELDIRR
jgi:hypothetical protein